MFDIAASELLIIAVVALIVIGPEKLPRVARTLGHLFGRMQRYVNDVKADIQREVELDELRKLKQTVEDSARSIETSVSQELHGARDEVRNLEALVEAQETVPVAKSDAGAMPASPMPAGVAGGSHVAQDPVVVEAKTASMSAVQPEPKVAGQVADSGRPADVKPS